MTSRCEDLVGRELRVRTNRSIEEVNDVLVRLLVRTVASHIKGLSQELCQGEHRTSITSTYGSARRVLAELRLDLPLSSTAYRPDRTASPRVSRITRLWSPG